MLQKGRGCKVFKAPFTRAWVGFNWPQRVRPSTANLQQVFTWLQEPTLVNPSCWVTLLETRVDPPRRVMMPLWFMEFLYVKAGWNTNLGWNPHVKPGWLANTGWDSPFMMSSHHNRLFTKQKQQVASAFVFISQPKESLWCKRIKNKEDKTMITVKWYKKLLSLKFIQFLVR